MNRSIREGPWNIVGWRKDEDVSIFFLVLGCACLLLMPAASPASAEQRLSDEIEISSLDNNEYLPAAAYNSKHREYLVVWHTTWAVGSRDIRAARISETGELLDTFIVYEHATKDSAQPSVAYDPVNDRYLVTWVFDYFGNGSDWDLYGRFIPWNGPSAVLNEFLICSWGTHQWGPKVVYGTTVEEFLVVWMNEFQAGTPPMYISGRRIKAVDGSFPGGASDVTVSHASQQRVNPNVTYNQARNEYLVVYDNAADVFGMRLSGDLGSNFGGEFGIAGWPADEVHPAVAACKGADQYLVAWQSDQETGDDAIYGRFISGGGTPGNVYEIDDTTAREQKAAIACNLSGAEYLVAWQTEYAGGYFGVWGRLARPDEHFEPAFGLVQPGSNEDRTNPTAAGAQSTYMVAWEHERESGTYQNIHGRLVYRKTGSLPAVYYQLMD